MADKKRFECLELLGEGSFAKTWRARVLDPELIEHFGVDEVALKIPLANIQHQIALQRDIDLLATLHGNLSLHDMKNIVPYLGPWYHDDRTVLVMKYIPGGNLRTKIGLPNKHRRIPYDQVMPIIKGILSGLSTVHNQHIIHRDIKPENILLDHDNPLIADFGLSRIIREGEVVSNKGTYYYRAPEMFQKKDTKIHFNADIWSVGITWFEMLCGAWPFGITLETDDYTVMNLIIDKEVKLIIPADLDIPETLKKIISRMLQKDWQRRYKTAEEVLDDIKKMEEEIRGRHFRIQCQEAKRIMEDPVYAAGNEAILLKLVRDFPDEPEAYLLCGEYYNRRHSIQKAIRVYSQGANHCQSHQLFFELALALEKEDLSQAIAALEQSMLYGDDQFKQKVRPYYETWCDRYNKSF